MLVLENSTKTVPALNSVSSFVIIVSPINVATFGSLFLNMQVVLSMVEFSISTGFAETLLLIYLRFHVVKINVVYSLQFNDLPIQFPSSHRMRHVTFSSTMFPIQLNVTSVPSGKLSSNVVKNEQKQN